MRVLQIKVVAGPVKIRRHRRDCIEPVLAPIGLAHLDAGNLGNCVPLVGRLQLTGQQTALRHWLRRELRVDARRAEKQQFGGAVLPS
ncbi:hypothetical protein D3C81_1934490 [compost metagenome]